IKDTDYTVSGSVAVIKKSYLNYYFSKFPEQNLNLNFVFNTGKSAKLCIYTGTSPMPLISSSNFTYNVAAGEDVAIQTELNGNYISSITVGDNVSLLPRIDYTYSPTDKTIIIRKGFLQYYLSRSLSTAKFTVNFTGGSSVPFTVSPLIPQQPHNELSTASATFAAGTASDIVVAKTPGGTTFKGITYNSKQLTDGKDYTVSGDKITLKATFLNTLPEGTSTLAFGIQQGNSVNFNVTVTKPQTTSAGVTVTIGNANLASDNTATIPISIKGVYTSINNFDFKLSYDEKAVDSVTVEAGDIIPCKGDLLSNGLNGLIVLAFEDITQGSRPITKDGMFANIKIKMKPGYTDAQVKLSEEGACCDTDMNYIPVKFFYGETPAEVLPVKSSSKDVYIYLESTYLDNDNTSTVSASLGYGQYSTNNLDLKLSYDENAVDSINVTPGIIVPNPSSYFKSEVANGKISLLFAGGTSKSQSITMGGAFANIKVKLKPGFSSTQIKILQAATCNDSNPANIHLDPISKVITLAKQQHLTVTYGKEIYNSDNTITLPITIEGITDSINNVDFKLAYDSNTVDSATATAGDIIPDAESDFAYIVKPGGINFLFSDNTQGTKQITKDGVLANITFKLKPGVSSTQFKLLEQGAFSDIELRDIPVTCLLDKTISLK
ncbi:MAG TPA: cohesin domain-containing protein, partial [Clostridia bacterium]